VKNVEDDDHYDNRRFFDGFQPSHFRQPRDTYLLLERCYAVATCRELVEIGHVVDTHAENDILASYEFALSSLFVNLSNPALRALSIFYVAR
jgi:hypothetical protein